MLTAIIEKFKAGNTHGLKVLVLPDDQEAMESTIIDSQLRTSVDPTEIAVGICPARALPLHSISEAIVSGYARFSGKTGQIKTGIQKVGDHVSDAVGAASIGILGAVTKLFMHYYANTPVSRLQKPPYTVDSVAMSLKELCRKNQVILCIRKSHEDHSETQRFLAEQCGLRLGQMLEEDRKKLLVVLFLRQSDLDSNFGITLKAMADDGQSVEIVELESSGEDEPNPLTELLKDVDARVIDVLRHVAVYLDASNADIFSSSLIQSACGLKDAKLLDSLRAKEVIQVVGSEGTHLFWGLTERFDRWDIEAALDQIAEQDAGDEITPYLLLQTEASEALSDADEAAQGIDAGTVLKWKKQLMVCHRAYSQHDNTILVYRTADGNYGTVEDEKLVKAIKKGEVRLVPPDEIPALGDLLKVPAETLDVLSPSQSAANNLFRALSEIEGETNLAVPILLNLARIGTFTAQAVRLASQYVAHLTEQHDLITLRSILTELHTFFDDHAWPKTCWNGSAEDETRTPDASSSLSFMVLDDSTNHLVRLKRRQRSRSSLHRKAKSSLLGDPESSVALRFGVFLDRR